MTAMMSLRSRLALSKLALRLPAELALAEPMLALVTQGVDLLVLDGEQEEVAIEAILGLRRAFGTLPLLVATTDGEVAKAVSADVVHIARPGWKLWGTHPKGHQWTLLGRGVRDARTVAKPGDDWDYLFVGLITDPGASSRVLTRAVTEQRPFDPAALPWFAQGDFTVDQAQRLVGQGVRRIALDMAVPDPAKLAELVPAVSNILNRAWKEDPDAESYRFTAAGL